MFLMNNGSWISAAQIYEAVEKDIEAICDEK
jgi:hypothetical protein